MNVLRMSRSAIILSVCFELCGYCANNTSAASASTEIDLTDAVIVVGSSGTVQARAADMLSDEIAKRTGVRLKVTGSMPNGGKSAILIGRAGDMTVSPPGDLKVPSKADGYAIWADNNTVYLLGRDDRGALFAAGRLIRLLAMSKGKARIAADLRLASAPEYPIRGHQLGYRNLNNTYDTWDPAAYEQYIRDLIIFGTNAIELLPTLNVGSGLDGHMKQPKWQMNKALSKLIGSYGLEVWVRITVYHDDLRTAEAEKQTMAKRRRLFENLDQVDALFVPGGDGGDTPPEILMPWLGRLAKVLRRVHPKATLWVSNQTYESEENDFFFSYLQREAPDWLEGVVYGPWTTVSIPEVRRRIPSKYKIRRYPDVGHCLGCQYPVPQWDRAFSQTLGREPICPRPRAVTHIHNLYAPFCDGFITYSDGVNEDLNKFVFTALGWDSKTAVEKILQEYGKVFFGDEYADAVAGGLLALENNWVGPIAENQGIDQTLQVWRDIARQDGGRLGDNWRLQLHLFRAYYDSFLKHKAAAELDYEARAYEALKQAPQKGVAEAISQARLELGRTDTERPGRQLREQIEKLGSALFKSIGMQLSTRAPYRASGPRRGAVMDYLDRPLNDRLWLESQFRHILGLQETKAQLARIDRIVNWDDPGPGGFYDDLGFVGKYTHLVRQKTWQQDPQFLESPIAEQYYSGDVFHAYKLSWQDQTQMRYRMVATAPADELSPQKQARMATQDRPLLTMRYEDLDKHARYRVRVTYHGHFRPVVRLVADGSYEVHGPLAQPKPTWPVEFDVPTEASRDGTLTLQWRLLNGARGCQVAEVWLIRQH
ncbi:MAG: glycoside hydrolase family 20 zincin-like fold domain-containing protein [Planctomycetota bacterium]